ncbi:hypothetical protein CTAYLR_004538 [Chrysophaeum taylorii]|uniref:Alginate lyase domain-containing protein n=1 Tax=Chrysophaeum taylorii TaxID=2483200 RepID=A0AAD7XRH0_9STRA|nr:hypothetical protein CTAYLR_004538 [Chrysophaeum taylorii]
MTTTDAWRLLVSAVATVATAAGAKPDPVEAAAVNARIVDLQTRSGHLMSAKALALMRSPWPLGAVPERQLTDKVGLYRIIGNPLPPRHDAQQLDRNLRYMLDREPPLQRAEKIFVLNRLNESLEERARSIISAYGHETVVIKFDPNEYRPYQAEDTYGLAPKDWGDLIHPKFHRMNANLYLMNNNGARNTALRHGVRNGFRWTLPLDGNCFFTEHHWNALLAELDDYERRNIKFAALPMVRTTAREPLEEILHPDQTAKNKSRRRTSSSPSSSSSSSSGADVRVIDDMPGLAANAGPGEHQIAFHSSAMLRFDPTVPYGHRPKVSMLWKLGIPGAWDKWNHDFVFRSEGACDYWGLEKRIKLPSVCRRTLPRVGDVVTIGQTTETSALVYRLPDAWPAVKKKPSASALSNSSAPHAAGDDFFSRRNRRDLRDVAIMDKIAAVNAEFPSSTRHAAAFRKPLYFNVFSMESMRRECVVYKAELHEPRGPPPVTPDARPPRGLVDQHHCAQIDALVALAEARLGDRPMSVVDKEEYVRANQRPIPIETNVINNHSKTPFLKQQRQRPTTMRFPTPPANATPHHFQNIGGFNWRVAELPLDVDASEVHLILPRRTPAADKSSLLPLDNPEFRRRFAEEFVRWDGHHRPDGRLWGPGSPAYDRTRSYDMLSNVTLYSLAHFYTGDARFARKAVSLFRAWFIDRETRMLPTMEFAQWSRPSRESYGVVQLKDLAFAFDALALLQRSTAWTNADEQGMRTWCARYLDFLASSQDRTSRSAHGWWFLLQYSAVARCAGHSNAQIKQLMSERVDKLVSPVLNHRGNNGVISPLDSSATGNPFGGSYAPILAWRALHNLGDLPMARKLATILRTTAATLDLDAASRRLMLRRSRGINTTTSEAASPLCQWALDFDFAFGSALAMCRHKHIPRRVDPGVPPIPSHELEKFALPPLLPSNPLVGIFPFMNLAW